MVGKAPTRLHDGSATRARRPTRGTNAWAREMEGILAPLQIK